MLNISRSNVFGKFVLIVHETALYKFWNPAFTWPNKKFWKEVWMTFYLGSICQIICQKCQECLQYTTHSWTNIYIVKSTSFLLQYKDIGTKYFVEDFFIENVKDLLATKEGNYINSFLRLCHEEHKICILLE